MAALNRHLSYGTLTSPTEVGGFLQRGNKDLSVQRLNVKQSRIRKRKDNIVKAREKKMY
jgi:hypothetical protein